MNQIRNITEDEKEYINKIEKRNGLVDEIDMYKIANIFVDMYETYNHIESLTVKDQVNVMWNILLESGDINVVKEVKKKLCYKCRKELEPRRITYCKECRKEENAYNRAVRLGRRQPITKVRLCKCGNELEEGSKKCQTCKDNRHCSMCDKPRANSSAYCIEHLKIKNKEYYRSRMGK